MGRRTPFSPTSMMVSASSLPAVAPICSRANPSAVPRPSPVPPRPACARPCSSRVRPVLAEPSSKTFSPSATTSTSPAPRCSPLAASSRPRGTKTSPRVWPRSTACASPACWLSPRGRCAPLGRRPAYSPRSAPMASSPIPSPKPWRWRPGGSGSPGWPTSMPPPIRRPPPDRAPRSAGWAPTAPTASPVGRGSAARGLRPPRIRLLRGVVALPAHRDSSALRRRCR